MIIIFYLKNIIEKVFKPSSNEVSINYASRSAKLRFAIRSKNNFIKPTDLFKKFRKFLEIEAINV